MYVRVNFNFHEAKKAEVILKEYFSMESKQGFWLCFGFCFHRSSLFYTVMTHIFPW